MKTQHRYLAALALGLLMAAPGAAQEREHTRSIARYRISGLDGTQVVSVDGRPRGMRVVNGTVSFAGPRGGTYSRGTATPEQRAAEEERERQRRFLASRAELDRARAQPRFLPGAIGVPSEAYAARGTSPVVIGQGGFPIYPGETVRPENDPLGIQGSVGYVIDLDDRLPEQEEAGVVQFGEPISTRPGSLSRDLDLSTGNLDLRRSTTGSLSNGGEAFPPIVSGSYFGDRPGPLGGNSLTGSNTTSRFGPARFGPADAPFSRARFGVRPEGRSPAEFRGVEGGIRGVQGASPARNGAVAGSTAPAGSVAAAATGR